MTFATELNCFKENTLLKLSPVWPFPELAIPTL